MYKLTALSLTTYILAMTSSAFAHEGRRLEVQVVDDQLVARGYISEGVDDDGGGQLRPYYNAIHDHWSFIPGPTVGAFADLPGYDIFTPGPLTGHDVNLELLGAEKWVSPPVMPLEGTIPDFEPLGPGETISIGQGAEVIDTDTLGSFTLASSIPVDGDEDLDLEYTIGLEPSDVLFILQWQLSTDAPGVAESDTIYTIFSPDGSTPEEKLHHTSLFTENYLGTTVVPEPASVILFAIGIVVVIAKRRWQVSGT